MAILVLQAPGDMAASVARRARARRVAAGFTQRGLAERAGMSLSSLRKFERTGQIALDSLLRIAFALDAMKTIGFLE